MAFLLHQLLASAAERFPTQNAVTWAGQRLRYGELQEKSTHFAKVLAGYGVRRGDRIGIYMEKSLESVVALYGILQAGAAYVPLDLHAPPARSAEIIQDCGIQVLVTKESKLPFIRKLLSKQSPLRLLIGVTLPGDQLLECLSWEDVYERNVAQSTLVKGTELDLAYILYTSGSTGTPKGIMHTHRSALSFVEWAVQAFAITANDRLSNHAHLHFDLSIFDIFASAATGASVTIIPENVTRLPASLAQLIEEEQLTIWYSVPFALMQLLERGGIEKRDFSSLRSVLFAGERFATRHLSRLMALLPHARFYNLYGPTETNVCTFYEVPMNGQESEKHLPIGQACSNTELIVVDADNQPLASGEIGELLVRGPIVMQGYWGMPEVNSQAFFDQSQDLSPKTTFYRTGDLVSLTRDGNYQLIDRKDRQVKIRGYRVELDEIEMLLYAHPGVEEAAAYTLSEDDGSLVIEATVVLLPKSSLTPTELLAYLRQRIPPYALPAKVIIASDLPRTSTGKVSRLQLQRRMAFPQGNSGGEL